MTLIVVFLFLLLYYLPNEYVILFKQGIKMAILIFLCVVIGVLLISYYINKQEWEKDGEMISSREPTTKPTQQRYLVNNPKNRKFIDEQLQEKYKTLTKGKDVFSWRGVNYELSPLGIFYFKPSLSLWVSTSELHTDWYSLNEAKEDIDLSLHCYFEDEQSLFNLLQDFIKEAVPSVSAKQEVENVKSASGLFKQCSSYLGHGIHRVKWADQWVSINDGEYYSKDLYVLYKFDDWSVVRKTEEVLSIIRDAKIWKCENPHKIHWEHFLELEMKAKKQRELDCHKFVDGVLEKQIKYNDLQLKYEMLPSAPITDIETFKNFCKLVSEKVGYDDYEIQNYLFLKRSK